jgi:hypothetical protein
VLLAVTYSAKYFGGLGLRIISVIRKSTTSVWPNAGFLIWNVARTATRNCATAAVWRSFKVIFALLKILKFAQNATVPVRVDWTVLLAAEIVKNTRSAKTNAKTRSSTTKNTNIV